MASIRTATIVAAVALGFGLLLKHANDEADREDRMHAQNVLLVAAFTPNDEVLTSNFSEEDAWPIRMVAHRVRNEAKKGKLATFAMKAPTGTWYPEQVVEKTGGTVRYYFADSYVHGVYSGSESRIGLAPDFLRRAELANRKGVNAALWRDAHGDVY